MSPHVGNFVADLVEMAKATEELPLVKAELSGARSTIEDQQAKIQRLELKLLDHANEINDLQAKLREAEVARDDAELRFLEVEDKLGRVLNLVRGMGETLGQAVVDVTPRPEPTTEPIHEAQPLGQSEPGPTVNSPYGNPWPSVASHDAETKVDASPLISDSPAPEVAPPANPTAPSAAGNGPSSETATATPNADAGADASSDPYRNEPFPKYSAAWHDWANDMDHKYGFDRWPDRVA